MKRENIIHSENFVPKNFDGILDEEDDCVDFILVLEPVFEVK